MLCIDTFRRGLLLNIHEKIILTEGNSAIYSENRKLNPEMTVKDEYSSDYLSEKKNVKRG